MLSIPMLRHFSYALALALLFASCPAAVNGQDDNDGEEHFLLESADTTSPRGTLVSFIEAMHEIYVAGTSDPPMRRGSPRSKSLRNRAFRCLDTSEFAPAVHDSMTREAAVCLKEILDRVELPSIKTIPDLTAVEEEGITKWTLDKTEIKIVKITEGPREGEFLFSSDTVARAKDFYDVAKGDEYQKRELVTPYFYRKLISDPGPWVPKALIPNWSMQRVWGQAIWQWFGLSIVLTASIGIMLAIYMFGRRYTMKVRSNLARYVIAILFPLSALLIPAIAQDIVTQQLNIYGNLVVTVTAALQIFFLVALTIMVISVGNRVAEVVIATSWIKPRRMDSQLVRLVCRIASIGAATVVVLEGGRQLGIPLTTLVAGAGVGGLTLALAAQDSLKNILGSMMIMLDKPFRIGERIVMKGYDGTVEDIGLRSTRIRLLTGHQVSVPNEEMARSVIENIGRRPFIRQSATIEIPSTTPSAKIDRALEILRDILKDHEGMEEDFPPRVHLRDVNAGSIGIIMIFWYHPPDYWKFLEFNEHVTLSMSRKFEAEGIEFATPNLTLRRPTADSS